MMNKTHLLRYSKSNLLYQKAVVLAFILLTFTAFPQTNWEKYDENPVLGLGPEGSWDSQSIETCSVVYHDNMYHIWYGGYDGMNFRIGHATSGDGLIWTKDTENPVLDIGAEGSWEEHFVYIPSVLIKDNVFHMWYGGRDYNEIEQIGHATSADGSAWVKDTLNPVLKRGSQGNWDDEQAFPMPGSIIYFADTFKIWYGGYDGITYATGHATSVDGSTWTKSSYNPVMEAGSSENFDWYTVVPGTVIYDGTIYHQWYSGSGTDYRYRIGYATSEDGINWEKDIENNPVLDFGIPDSWDFIQAWCGSVVFDNNENMYKMWYTGGDFYSGKIGYATCLLTGFEDILIKESLLQLTNLEVFPHPFNSKVTLQYDLKTNTKVLLTIYNHLGMSIFSNTVYQTKGKQNIIWEASDVSVGVYFYCLRTEKDIISGKLIKAGR